jgi:hypothetical protein
VALIVTSYKSEADLFCTLLQKSWMQHNVLGSVGQGFQVGKSSRQGTDLVTSR